jgi:hypothetical protein
MSVVLWIYGNHSIPFKQKEIKNKTQVLDLLNSLHVENSDFINEMCKKWHSPLGYDKDWDIKREKQFEQYSKIKFWNYDDEDDYYNHTKEYTLIGPFGLEIEITRYYLFISPWIGRYHFWYDVIDKEKIEWRDTWREIIYKIINILGGNTALYFPDNMSDLSAYLPTEYNMPEFDRLVEIIRKEYRPVFTSFKKATDLYIKDKLENDPFVIDRFEDLLYKR